MSEMIQHGSQSEIEKVSADEINAKHWINVTQDCLNDRIAQYDELGNHEAAQELSELHQDTLNMLREGVDNKDSGFLSQLSRLEEAASDGKPYQTPNYVIAHVMQLDGFVQMVRNAQNQVDINKSQNSAPSNR